MLHTCALMAIFSKIVNLSTIFTQACSKYSDKSSNVEIMTFKHGLHCTCIFITCVHSMFISFVRYNQRNDSCANLHKDSKKFVACLLN